MMETTHSWSTNFNTTNLNSPVFHLHLMSRTYSVTKRTYSVGSEMVFTWVCPRFAAVHPAKPPHSLDKAGENSRRCWAATVTSNKSNTSSHSPVQSVVYCVQQKALTLWIGGCDGSLLRSEAFTGVVVSSQPSAAPGFEWIAGSRVKTKAWLGVESCRRGGKDGVGGVPFKSRVCEHKFSFNALQSLIVS